MSIIPLDVQRRCERRWTARFSPLTESVAPRSQRPERESLQIVGTEGEGEMTSARRAWTLADLGMWLSAASRH
jgi:hypothetical protein